MGLEDARTIGARLRRIRRSRDKPLVGVAGLAGMSKSQLDRIERGGSRAGSALADRRAGRRAADRPERFDAASGARTALGLAAYGATRAMLDTGAFDLAKEDLTAVEVPTTTPESTQLAGMLALSHSLVAAADSHHADAEAALEHAAELAQRTGEGTAYGLGFGPTNVGLWRMEAMLQTGDHELVTALAASLNPNVHPYRSRRSSYWRDYGRTLARVRGRHDDAVLAFRRAETLHPHRVQCDPFAREVLAELLEKSPRGPVGRKLRGMAYRAGLEIRAGVEM